MKKIVSILLVVLMLAALMPHAALAEEEKAPDWTGLWADAQFDRASFMILNDNDGWSDDLMGTEPSGGYLIEMYWSNSADSYDAYRIVAHPEGSSLVYDNGLYVRFSSDDSEEADTQGTQEVLEEHGKGSFTLTEEGTLKWEDSFVTAAAEMTLAKEQTETPSAQELADEYFHVIAGIETESAGNEMKQAAAVLDVYQFCFKYALWQSDPETLGANMAAAREMLTEEEREAFDANEPAITAEAVRLLDENETLTGAYDDAGAAENLASLRDDASVRSGVSFFLACVATLENIGEP